MPVKADIVGDRIVLDCEYQHQERIKRMIGAKHDKIIDKWTLPLTWSACVALLEDFGPEFLASDELNAWGYRERDERVGPSLELRDRLDLEGLDTTKSDRSTQITVTTQQLGETLGLFPYQRVGAAWMAINGRALLLDEQGTGKTVQTISAIRTLQRHEGNPFPVLIVAPASVKRVWETQFEKWYPGLTVVNLKGTAEQRRKQLTQPAHVYIASYNNVVAHSRLMSVPGADALKRCTDCGGFDEKILPAKCQVHERELNKLGIRTVVVDEAHRIINTKTATTRAVWAVADKAPYRYALTGTPVERNLADQWALLRFIVPDEVGGKTKFLDRYAIVGYTPWGTVDVQGVNPLKSAELQAVMAPYTRRVLKETVLSFLPPVYHERRIVEMAGAQAKAYRDMQKTMMAALEGKTLVTLSPLTQASRLMQLASCYGEVVDPAADDGDLFSDAPPPSLKLMAPSNKVTAFLDDIANGDYDQTDAGVIVFAQSRDLLDLLSEALTAKKIEHGMITGSVPVAERDQAVDDFQAGKFKYILVSIAAGGAGLTLTAADTMVFLQRSWSNTAMTQAYARAHRIGSEIHESIRVIHYLSDKTVEEGQLDALESKTGRAEEILRDKDALRKWMAGEDE